MNPRVNTLGEALSRLAIATALLTALPSHADEQSEIDRLRAQIQELDQKLRILARKQEIAAEEATAKQKSVPVVNASDKGFGLKSSDGEFEYKLRGLAQVDYRHFDGSGYPDAVDGFLARRLRPTLEGSLFGKYGFRFTPEFGENKSGVVDAYFDVRHDPSFQVRVGKFKPFVGLERLQSGADIKFIERSYVSNNILPNRDLGVSVFGDVLDKKLSYALGVFNGVANGGETTTAQDINSEKEYTARLFATPFAGSESALQGLGFGIATTFGSSTGTTNADYRGRVSSINSGVGAFRTPGQANTFFNYKSTLTTTNNATADVDYVLANGRHVRWTPQAFFYRGPLGVIAEYAQSSQRVSRYGANNDWSQKFVSSDTLTSSAYQLAASWLLTGEDASFKGVKPFSPFRKGQDGGWGAFELLARYQGNDIDRAAADYADTTRGYALGARTFGVGLNWYLSESSKLSINYDFTRLRDVNLPDPPAGSAVAKNPLSGKTEQLFVARYQVAF